MPAASSFCTTKARTCRWSSAGRASSRASCATTWSSTSTWRPRRWRWPGIESRSGCRDATCWPKDYDQARRGVRGPRPLRRDDRAHPQRPHGAVQVHPQLPARAAAPAAQPLQGRQGHRPEAARTARREEARRPRRRSCCSPRSGRPKSCTTWTADPHEVTNLADDPKHKTTLDAMRKLLADWEEATGDQGRKAESPDRCTMRT